MTIDSHLIPVINNLGAPHDGALSKIHKLIAGKTKIDSVPSAVTLYDRLWDATWWGFDKSRVFLEFSHEQQTMVLSRCNESLLTEAYFIEKSGLAYCAKMTLLAESTDVAQLYSLIGADEAKHLAWIEPYLSNERKQLPQGHFLSFLSQLIEQCAAQPLIYLVQIILEGWGLDHYQRLSKGCSDSHLANVFASILKDEALHHKSGDLLFDVEKLTDVEHVMLDAALRTYTELIRVGPQMALGVVFDVAGTMTREQIIDVLTALDHRTESQRKLVLMKSLMRQPGLEVVVQTLEQERCFEPLSLEAASDFFQTSR